MSEFEQEINDRICTGCSVSILHPFCDEIMAAKGWSRCSFCGFCKVIEKEIYENRIRNQR